MLCMASSSFPVLGSSSCLKQRWRILCLQAHVLCSLLFSLLRISGSRQHLCQLDLTALCICLFPHSRPAAGRGLFHCTSATFLELIVRGNAVPQCLTCAAAQNISETWRQAAAMENWMAWAVLPMGLWASLWHVEADTSWRTGPDGRECFESFFYLSGYKCVSCFCLRVVWKWFC